MTSNDRGTAVTGIENHSPWHERFLGSFVKLHPGEGRCVLLFFTHAFLLLVCYYVLKTLREPLLLVEASPELKSYAYGTIALTLLVLLPAYANLFRRVRRARMTWWVTAFFTSNLVAFYALGRAGADIGFSYYVWVGVFSVTILAQFWGHAADALSVASGKRLFPAIMAAAAIGALVGPTLVGSLYSVLGPWHLMLVAIVLLAATLPLIERSRQAIPEGARAPTQEPTSSTETCRGGLSLVFRDPYLMLLAALMVVLNCVNTTGEYLLTDLVVRFAEERVLEDPSLSTGNLIAGFYSRFYFTVNLLTVLAQLFLVARLFRWLGVHGCLLVLPIIALLGYGLAVIVPVFGILKVIKVIENSADYSIMNTSRQALYLPLTTDQKYQGKIAIDAFFYRFGDLLQAGIVFAGINWLGFGFRDFALLNTCLAVLWVAIALGLSHRYSERTGERSELATLAVARRARSVTASLLRPAWHLYRNAAALLLTALLGIVALTASAPADAERPNTTRATQALFEDERPLEMEFYMDMKAFCRFPKRKGCEDTPALLSYVDASGATQDIDVSVRSRGRYSKETGNCRFPALFVFFEDKNEGTLFEGQKMLPLTTHCQHFGSEYEEYVLKEYLAYRIYNLLTDKSLQVRLARVTYHDTSGKRDPITRHAFFTEHFDSLAARHDSVVFETDRWDPRQGDPFEVGVHDLFQFMIGNTDWSTVYGHNVVLIRNRQGLVTPVPYDFDFSGLVNARYATPPPQLAIQDVRQRLFRGVCDDDTPWNRINDTFSSLVSIARELSPLTSAVQPDSASFLQPFFNPRSGDSMEAAGTACRSGRVPKAP